VALGLKEELTGADKVELVALMLDMKNKIAWRSQRYSDLDL